MTKRISGDSPAPKDLHDLYAEIPINLIDVEGQSVRDALNDDHVVELAMSIAKHGLLEAIVVRTKDGGRYQLEAGFHRLTAHVRLNKEYIAAHVRSDTTAPVKAIALIENILHQKMTLEEETSAVGHLHAEEKLSPSSICDLLGKSRAWVDQRLAIPNYPLDIQQELLDGNITIGKAEILATLEDPGTRAFVLNQAIHAKLTTKQTQDLVELYKATPTIEAAIQAGIEKKIEIQETPKSYKKCELCQRIRELIDIKFITVCADTVSCNQTMLEQLDTKGDEGHAA